ncbi:hypothetical protein V1509DRAFT_630742 [Lipomyces kononenkoae]
MDRTVQWYPLRVYSDAIAIKSYAPTPSSTAPAPLPLGLGDKLFIVEQSSSTDPAWYRGYLITSQPVSTLGKSVIGDDNVAERIAVGIFPASCVTLTESSLNERTPILASSIDSALQPVDLPILDEVAAALKEWCPTHIHDFFSPQTSTNTRQVTLSTLIGDLLHTRKSLLLGDLSDEDKSEAIKSAVWTLVRGNKLISGDVIVRNEESGALVTGRDDDLVKLFRDQQVMALSTHNSVPSSAAQGPPSGKELLHLMMRVPGIALDDGMSARFYICNKTRAITEAVQVDAGVVDVKVLFVDLPPAVVKDEIFMAIEVYETIYMTTQMQPVEPVRSQSYTIQGRRGVAIGVVEVGRVLREKAEVEREMVVRMFATKQVESTSNEWHGGWGTLRARVAQGSADGIQRSPKLDRVQASLRAFASPSGLTLTTALPSVFADMFVCPKALFATTSTIPRNELYLTLDGVSFASHVVRSKALYYITLSSSSDTSMPIMFRDAEQQKPSSIWTSCVVSRDEKIGESVCVWPLGTSSTDVVIVNVHAVDGRIIGRTVFPLWVDSVIVKDGPWTLSVTNSQGLRVGTLDITSYLVSTTLSADETLVALNRWRMARNSSTGQAMLLNVLKQVDYVDETEIIKLLRQVLDSLFGILAWKRGDVEFEDSVFAALVHVLDVTSEKGVNVTSMLDDYIRELFNYPIALAPLLYGYQRLLSNHIDPDVGAHVRSLLKIGKYILRLIRVSCLKYQSQEFVSAAFGTFPKILRHLFQQLCRIVEQEASDHVDPETAATVVAHQILALDHFAEYLCELRSFFTENELLELAIDFMESSASGCSSNPQLAMHQLVLLQSYTNLWLFSSSTAEVQKELASQTVGLIRPYLSAPTNADLATPAAWNSWKEKLRLCCSVLAHQFRILWPQRQSCRETCGLYVQLLPDVAATFVALQRKLKAPVTGAGAGAAPKFNHEFSLLFPEKFPFPPPRPVDTNAKKVPFDELSIELTLLQAVLSEFATFDTSLSTNDGKTLTEQEAITLMSNVLSMCNAVIRGDAFPINWISVYSLLHCSILSCMEFISLVLLELFVPSSEGQDQEADKVADLWYTFFRTLITLVGSEALAIESFAEQKRLAVSAIAGDVRERGAILLSKTWDAIGNDASPEETLYNVHRVGGFQARFITHESCDRYALVGQIIELWGSQDKVVLANALGMLRSMIIYEWNVKKKLDDIQSDIIDALGSKFKTSPFLMADSFSRGAFTDTLFEHFPVAGDALGVEARKLLTTVSRFLELSVDLHSLPNNDAYDDDRSICTLSLMIFLKDLGREGAFVRYVHELVQMQERAGHYAEAGLTLRLHAEMYDWRTDLQFPALAAPRFAAQTSFDRREQLYLQMVKYFGIGNAPELAISTYKELARVYESISFDLDKLATVTASIAKIYQQELSASAARPQPQYFRVAYHGLGFHRTVRGKQFIVQGNEWEKLSEFTERSQKMYPEAIIVTTATPTNMAVNKHISSASTLSSHSSSVSFDAEGSANAPGQYLQVTAVSPEPANALADAVGIKPNERDFFLRSDLRRFSVSRPVKSEIRASSNPADIWVEKVVFTTKEPFPTILRRSMIESSEITRVSPLSNAAGSVIQKTSEILHIARHALSHPDESHSAQLSMVVSGAVDAPVNGGIQQYRALLTSYATNDDADSREQKKRLECAIVDYVAVLKYALIVHARVVSSALRPLHDSLVVLFERNFKSELQRLADEGRVIDGMDTTRAGARGVAPTVATSEDAKSVLSDLTPQMTTVSTTGSHHQLQGNSSATTSVVSKNTAAAMQPPVAAPSRPFQMTQLNQPSTISLALDKNGSVTNLSVSVTNSSQHESVHSGVSASDKGSSVIVPGGGQNGSIANRMGRRISKMKFGSSKRSVTSLESL